MSTSQSNEILLDQEDRRIPITLLVLAFPIIASMVSRTAMNYIDFLMVSQLGTEAQAAIMPAGMVLFCILAAAMGLFSAVSTFVSQSLGRNQLADCSAYVWQGLYLSLLGGIILLPTWWLMPVIFSIAGHDPQVQTLENDYAQIGVLGLAPTMATFALSNFYNGIHRPMVAFAAALVGNAFNIAANYALIFGHWGFEPMGVAGAAIATQLACVVQMVVMIGWMFTPYYIKQFHTLKTWKPDLQRIYKLVSVGASAGVHFMTDIVAWTIFTLYLVGQFGTTQLAAHNVTFKFLELSFMPTVGLGVALTAAVGKFIGAGRHDRARRVTRWALLYSLIYMGLIATGYVTLHVLVGRMGPEPFKSWMTQDPDVIVWTSKLLLFCAIFQLFDALAITHTSALRGAGDTHMPALISFILAATVFLGGGFIITRTFPQWGSLGAWGVGTFYICTVGLVFWARWVWGPWEKIRLHDEPASAEEKKEIVDDTAVAASEMPPMP